MSFSNITGAAVRFNSSLSSADAKLSNLRGTIHFTTDGEIILNGEKYSGVTKVEESANNGYIKVDGSEVAIHGLGTAAYENSEAFATAAQGILADNAIPSSEKALANGVATLDANGHVPAAQLPSYVDDVLEYASMSSFPEEGEEGKIYVALDNNKTYRWGGTTYVVISETLAIGTTEGTAFSGKSGYDHVTNTEIHITDDERNTWNSKQDAISASNKISADMISDGEFNIVSQKSDDNDKVYTTSFSPEKINVGGSGEVAGNTEITAGSIEITAHGLDGKTDITNDGIKISSNQKNNSCEVSSDGVTIRNGFVRTDSEIRFVGGINGDDYDEEGNPSENLITSLDYRGINHYNSENEEREVTDWSDVARVVDGFDSVVNTVDTHSNSITALRSALTWD